MATMITEVCINCGACEPECPNQAISGVGDFFVIDPMLCTECVGFHDVEQCAAVCPVDCCVPDPNNPEPEALLVTRAREIHPEASIGEEFPSRFRTEEMAAPIKAAAAEGAPAQGAGDAAADAAPETAHGLMPLVNVGGKAITAKLKEFLEGNLGTGDYVTIAIGKEDPFTGRIYRLMLEEGWIAIEHDDGRRRAFFVTTGGRIASPDGEEIPLPS
jgi:4Fe-4S binding domain